MHTHYAAILNFTRNMRACVARALPLRRPAHLLKQRGIAALLSAASLASLTSAPLPEPFRAEHHVGKVVYVELVTPNLASAERFYGGLFGWAFHDQPGSAGDYREALLDGHAVAGLIQKPLPAGTQQQPAWLSYLAVRDVEATTRLARESGGKVLFEAQSAPERAREAILADPQGAVFAIQASPNGDPPDLLAAPGEWIWSSLMTSDADKGAAFYQSLFAYEVFDLPATDGAQHLLFAGDSFARASANTLPTQVPGARSHWLNYVRVDDAAASAAKAVTLGGRILVAAHPDRHGGKVAVIADPQGAAFGLMEWASNDNRQVSK